MRTRSVPSGRRTIRAIAPSTPTEYSSSGPGDLDLGVATGDQHDRPVAPQDVVDELEAARLADVERDDQIGEGHRVAQRQHAEPRGKPAEAALLIVVGLARGGADVDDGHWPSPLWIGTSRRGPLAADQRQLDAQHPVLVAGADARRRRRRRPSSMSRRKEPALDLDLLVAVGRGLGGAAAAGQKQLAPLDLQRDVRRVHAGELGRHDRPRRIRGVGDVDRRPLAGVPARQPGALEHVPEQLVHLASHPFEVGKQIPLRHGLSVDAARGRSRADGVDGTLGGQLHRPAEAVRALGSSELGVKLVGVVGEHEAVRVRPPCRARPPRGR